MNKCILTIVSKAQFLLSRHPNSLRTHVQNGPTPILHRPGSAEEPRSGNIIFCLFMSAPLGPERKGTQAGWEAFLPLCV